MSMSMRKEFQDLKAKWKQDTQFKSNMTEIVLHPAYQRIIGMGDAILILEDIKVNGPDHWGWALRAITGADLVMNEEDSGKVDKICSAWLAWGREYGMIDIPDDDTESLDKFCASEENQKLIQQFMENDYDCVIGYALTKETADAAMDYLIFNYAYPASPYLATDFNLTHNSEDDCWIVSLRTRAFKTQSTSDEGSWLEKMLMDEAMSAFVAGRGEKLA